MEKESEHIQRQKAYEMVAFMPIMQSLDVSEVDMSGEAPDIRFEYKGTKVGVEVIDCYPKEFDQKKEGAIKKLRSYLEEELHSKGIYGLHSVCLKGEIYSVGKISSIKGIIVEEVVGLIDKVFTGEHCKYVHSVGSLVSGHSNETLVQLTISGMFEVKTPPIEDVLSCIEKKNALYPTYDEALDEIWLLIYMPTNENYYSTKGVKNLTSVKTEFKRIYISDWMHNHRLIYEQR